MGTRVVRAVATVLLGAVLALLVGLGIAAVHPGPPEPTPPGGLAAAQEHRELAPSEQRQEEAHERERTRWREEVAAHSRTAAAVALLAGVALLALGVDLEGRHRALADGVLFGGLFTLLHGVVRGLASRDTLVAFSVVTAALLLVLALGWHRYVSRPWEDADGSEGQGQPLAEHDPDGGDVDVGDGGVLPDR